MEKKRAHMQIECAKRAARALCWNKAKARSGHQEQILVASTISSF